MNSSVAITCDEPMSWVGGTWADSRKPNRCTNRARFERVVGEQVIERLCGTHANLARRWKRDGEIRPLRAR